MKTPLIRLLRRAIRKAQLEDPSRRDFLRTTTLAGAAVALPSIITSCNRPENYLSRSGTERVLIVGAGIAGLNAAYQLHREGIKADVYEASNRTGGRILTAKNLLVQGAVTELGGELIDTTHTEMLSLAKHFDLDLIDLADEPYGSMHETFFFDGKRYTEKDVVREITPLLAHIKEEVLEVFSRDEQVSEASRWALDAYSIESYFSHLGLSGWLRSFLEVAFVTENGLELGEQSALNFLTTVGTEIRDEAFSVYGTSDERFKIRGGNQQLTDKMAAAVATNIHLGHELESIKKIGGAYNLTFRKDQSSIDVQADIVVLAIPFTLLRHVDLDVPLTRQTKSMIGNLKYGSNGKVVVGYNEAFWHKLGSNGIAYTDLPMQLCWDNTALQGVSGGGLTLFSGGSMCRIIGSMSKTDAVSMLTEHLRSMWPIEEKQTQGRSERIHWPDMPWARGSYSSYGPGQWTSYYGATSVTTEKQQLFFAGEHCSEQFRGFMNGAAASGHHVARKILAAIT